MLQRKDLFDFMLRQVKYTADTCADRLPQAFGRWFANMYFPGVTNIAITDGAGDGKIDLLITCQVGKTLRHHILNTKYTNDYDRHSPVSFYDEITRYWQAFANKTNRAEYLANVVREPLRIHYKKLFRLYDEGAAQLYFVTNHKANDAQFKSVSNYDVTILHLDDVLQYVAEHIEGAMPETDPLLLTGISNVLTPATNESEVPTSIVFARLVDFITYMENDPFDLLFARNVRLWLGNTETNKDIQNTFRNAPKEFAYSNNGITVLCRKHNHDLGKQELLLVNPRVVNGSQTLHSVRSVDNPSALARVMVRVIEVPPTKANDLPELVEKRKEIIHKISIRTNLQNPIRRWNLVANDDFQNDLSRYFWGKRLYYERRQHEWKFRKLELVSIGISKGPDIRWMTQLIAAHHYDRKKLGPAAAHGRLNALFEEDAYAIIRATPPNLAYQIYLLAEFCERWLKRLSNQKQYIANVYGYIDLALFALLCRIFAESHIRLGTESMEQRLDSAYDEDAAGWRDAIKQLVDHILSHYKQTSKRVMKKDGNTLTPANYFKNATYIGQLIAKPIPRRVRAIAHLLPHTA